MVEEVKINKQNPTIAKFLDLGQRLVSLFLANALPAITTGAVIGISVGKAAIIKVVSALAEASVDGELDSEEIKQAFSGAKKK